MAASPCGVYKSGQALPASAFTVTYLRVTNETLGNAISSKQVALDFGFRISDEAKSCGVTNESISSSNSGGISRAYLTNGTTYTMTNGGSVPANGSAGTVDTSCQGGLGGTQACGTSGLSAYSVNDSQNTRNYSVSQVSVYRSITVSGYGTSIVYFNASIPTSGSFPHWGTSLSATSQPAF